MANKQVNIKDEQKLRDNLIARAWQEPAFKAKLLKNPRAALAEVGYKLPDNIKINIFEDKPNNFNFVIPLPPQDTRELSDQEIQKLAAGAGNEPLGYFDGVLHKLHNYPH